MDDINNLHRLDGESDFEWKLRCCLAKKRRETDMDWVEIRDMLGLSITPDQLRKQAVGYEEYDNYINGYNGVATTILSISDLHVPFQLNYEVLENIETIWTFFKLMVMLLIVKHYQNFQSSIESLLWKK